MLSISQDLYMFDEERESFLLKQEQSCSLNNKNVRAMFEKNKLTEEQFMKLDRSQLWYLREEHIATFIINNILTIEQFIQLNSEQSSNLNRKDIRVLIENGNITIEQFIQFNETQQRYLRYETISSLIDNNTLTAEQFMLLGNIQLRYLLNQDIQFLIDEKYLTIAQFIQLNDFQLSNICHENILDLIENGNITTEQFMQFNEAQIAAIINIDEDTLNRVFDGNLNIEDAIAGNNIITINDEQSTHNFAIHKSVSVSVIKLKQDYEQFINTKDTLDEVIARIKAKIFSLPDSLKNNAAKSCIHRLAADNYQFADQTSHTTTKELLALIFLAILDEEKRTKNNINISSEEAFSVFIQGLYEIQRGYNLSHNEVDDMLEDSPICAGGTFNKLIEKLIGIYPDCNICFITHKTQALKFPKIVEEAALRYLTGLANPTTSAEFLNFNKLINSIKQNGLQIIYNQIKDDVANLVFTEFGSLYESKLDESFAGLVKTIEDVELDDKKLNQFQQSIKNSLGYQQYCSSILYRSTGNLSFFSKPKNEETERELEEYFSSLSLSKK